MTEQQQIIDLRCFSFPEKLGDNYNDVGPKFQYNASKTPRDYFDVSY